MSKRLVDVVDGVATYADYEEKEDKLIIERVQDVEPIIEANKRAFNDAPETGRYSGDMHHVAQIPMVVIEDYCKKKGLDFHTFMADKKEWKRFLNDPDHRAFRTRPGRV